MRKIVSLVLAFALFLSVAAMGASAEGGKTELSFMMWDEGTGDPIVEAMKKAIEDFNATNEYNVEIVPEYIASEQTKTKLPTMMAANAAPDLFNAWVSGYLEPYVSAGKVYDISDALAADPEWADSFLNGTFSYLTFDDGIYGVPMQISVWSMYYNTDIFAAHQLELPETWDELIKDLKTIRDADPDILPIAFGNKSAWPIASLSEALNDRIGGSEAFDQASKGKIPWTSDTFISSAKKIAELVDEKLLIDGVNALPTEETAAQFKTGKTAVMSILDNRIGMLAGSPVEGKFVLRNVPPVEGGTGDANLWLGQPNRTICISETCPNKEAAVAFLKYMTSPKVVQYNVDNAGIIPVIKGNLIDTSKIPSANAQLLNELQSMSGMFVFYDVVMGSVLGTEYNNTIQSIVAGTDPAEALAQYQSFFEENYEA